MLIKLQEAHKIGSTIKDTDGRTVAQSKLIYRDLYINPDHIISINEDIEGSRATGERISRIETTRGIFVVSGTPSDIQNEIFGLTKTKPKVLRD